MQHQNMNSHESSYIYIHTHSPYTVHRTKKAVAITTIYTEESVQFLLLANSAMHLPQEVPSEHPSSFQWPRYARPLSIVFVNPWTVLSTQQLCHVQMAIKEC